MKRYNLAYYFLTMLLVMGGFAAMAQNRYGLFIMGGVAICFALIFAGQFIREARSAGPHRSGRLAETGALFIFAFVFVCRIFYIEIPWLDRLLQVAGLVLVIVYLGRLISQYRTYAQQPLLSLRLSLFYAAVLFMILAVVSEYYNSLAAQVCAIAGLLLFVLYLLTGLIKKQFSAGGHAVTANGIIARQSSSAWLLVSLLCIFTLYWGLTRTGFLPPLYSDQYPQAYFELVRDAASGKEKPVDGTYRYEAFKKNYQDFIKRWGK